MPRPVYAAAAVRRRRRRPTSTASACVPSATRVPTSRPGRSRWTPCSPSGAASCCSRPSAAPTWCASVCSGAAHTSGPGSTASSAGQRWMRDGTCTRSRRTSSSPTRTCSRIRVTERARGGAGEPATRHLPVNWHLRPLQRRVPSRGFSRAGDARPFVATGLLALAAAACSHPFASPPGGNLPPERPTLSPTYRPTGHMAAGDVFVHPFEWKWPDIAAECENVLGPAGFKAVQISPPQEHSVQPPTYPWSERYQPVSYSIARSRSGTGAEFADMVQRCKAVGVDIYVDAVINHMTNYPSPGVGSDGTAYTKYNYPGLYAPSDFHAPCTVSNYQDAANVQDCELFGLPDLNTGKDSVRRKIAGYLIMLARMGVAGFRIDAAKHVQQVELDDILTIVDSTVTAEGRSIPYYFLEVIGGAGEALSPRDYFGEGYTSGGAADLTEFTFVGVGDKFRGIGGQHISQLNPNGTSGNRFSESAWGLMPSDKAVVFLQNHDTQHQCGISYRDGSTFR